MFLLSMFGAIYNPSFSWNVQSFHPAACKYRTEISEKAGKKHRSLESPNMNEVYCVFALGAAMLKGYSARRSKPLPYSLIGNCTTVSIILQRFLPGKLLPRLRRRRRGSCRRFWRRLPDIGVRTAQHSVLS